MAYEKNLIDDILNKDGNTNNVSEGEFLKGVKELTQTAELSTEGIDNTPSVNAVQDLSVPDLEVNVTWNFNGNPDGYYIYRSEEGSNDELFLDDFKLSENNINIFKDTQALEVGKTYIYSVQPYFSTPEGTQVTGHTGKSSPLKIETPNSIYANNSANKNESSDISKESKNNSNPYIYLGVIVGIFALIMLLKR